MWQRAEREQRLGLLHMVLPQAARPHPHQSRRRLSVKRQHTNRLHPYHHKSRHPANSHPLYPLNVWLACLTCRPAPPPRCCQARPARPSTELHQVQVLLQCLAVQAGRAAASQG